MLGKRNADGFKGEPQVRCDVGEILACPQCRHDLPSPARWPSSGHRCEGCGATVPLIRGIPRFVKSDAYAASFSFEWNLHRLTRLDRPGSEQSEQAFREKTGFTPEEVRGKLVLDVGCGMRRFADLRLHKEHEAGELRGVSGQD